MKGFLIVDFVSNAHDVGMYLSIPADELIPLVRGISTFSALGEKLSDNEKKFAGGSDFLERMFSQLFNSSSLQKHFQGMYSVFEKEKYYQVDGLIETFVVYQKLLKKYTKISELLGFKSVLNHGDLWQSNMIHSMENNGKLKLEAIIDWQSTVILPPGLDTAELIVGCLSAEVRNHR